MLEPQEHYKRYAQVVKIAGISFVNLFPTPLGFLGRSYEVDQDVEGAALAWQIEQMLRSVVDGPMVFAGDFNTDDVHSVYREFIEDLGLGLPLDPATSTVPGWDGAPDQVLTSAEFHTVDSGLEITATDHYPVYADLLVTDPESLGSLIAARSGEDTTQLGFGRHGAWVDYPGQKAAYYTNRYGTKHYGVAAEIEPAENGAGVLRFRMKAGPGTPSVRTMFRELMDSIPRAVHEIHAHWDFYIPGNKLVRPDEVAAENERYWLGDDLEAFNSFMQDIFLSPEDAARNTPTGEMAAEYGYNRVQSVTLKGHDGEDAVEDEGLRFYGEFVKVDVQFCMSEGLADPTGDDDGGPPTEIDDGGQDDDRSARADLTFEQVRDEYRPLPRTDAELRARVDELTAQGWSGLRLVRRLAEEFGARNFPEESGIVFHGSAEPRDVLLPYSSPRYDKPDPDRPAVFFTVSADVAAFCSIFNRGRLADQVERGVIEPHEHRRANFMKSWVDRGVLRVDVPPDTMNALERTDSPVGMVVTPQMWGWRPMRSPLGGCTRYLCRMQTSSRRTCFGISTSVRRRSLLPSGYRCHSATSPIWLL